MVIVSNDWIKYNDEQKNIAMENNDIIMMAAAAAENSVKTEEVAPSVELARIILLCQSNSHPFQTRNIQLEPNVEYKVGRSIARSRVSENNAIFDCKVLSRNHAVLWYSEGKFYVKDTKSSNGTFINERKITQSEAEELTSGDVVKFGVDVIENSRKEVHGCIIACVKLYMPDGRESISINNAYRSSSCAEGNISFDEIHRLHHYMQETMQREKHLEIKLHDVQNVLDVTRKNSSSCWQSMIDEDRLLNRIDILENKLQFMQKNSPENQLKEEILKMQDDKYLYQNSAKEALRKVYQERMDAMGKLSTIERALCSSEDECSLLREQLLYTQQNLQDVNSRLMGLESEYREYREQAKVHEIDENNLKTQLEAKDQECEEYKNKIEVLLSEKSTSSDEKQGDEKSPKENEDDDENSSQTTKCTIMKWLENSNINQDEESKSILKAICNASDSSDGDDENLTENDNNEVLNDFNKTQLESQSQSKIDDDNSNLDVENESIEKGQPQEPIQSTISALQEAFNYSQPQIGNISTTEDNYKETVKESKEEIEMLKEEIERKTLLLTNYEQIADEMRLLKMKLTDMEQEINLLKDEKTNLIKVIEENEMNRKFIEATVAATVGNESNYQNDGVILPRDDGPQTKKDIENGAIIENYNDDEIIKSDLAAINNAVVQQEEELIIIKEKYETILSENIKLKNDIKELNCKSNIFLMANQTKILSYGAVIIAIVFYFIFLYFKN